VGPGKSVRRSARLPELVRSGKKFDQVDGSIAVGSLGRDGNIDRSRKSRVVRRTGDRDGRRDIWIHDSDVHRAGDGRGSEIVRGFGSEGVDAGADVGPGKSIRRSARLP